MKKILIINHAFVLDINRTVYKDLSKYPELEITLLAPKYWCLKEMNRTEKFEKVNLTDENYKVIYFLGFFLFHPSLYFFSLGFFFLLFKEKFDVVIVQEDVYSFISFLVTFLKVIFRYKFIIDSWQNILKKYKFPFSFFQKFILKYLNIINAGGHEIIKVLRSKGYNKEITITPLAYDRKLFTPESCDSELLKSLNLNGVVIGYFGCLIKEKGVQYLIEALSASSFEYTLIIGTTGLVFKENDVNDLKQKLEELALNPKLRNKLREEGIVKAKEKYSTEAVAKIYFNQINNLLKEGD
ncbi:hypothetical protein KAU33_05820 [Candidatus Dependentiae bacterium]|nr:hypothetical protein [Candidatus Dependentiae bacterium]